MPSESNEFVITIPEAEAIGVKICGDNKIATNKTSTGHFSFHSLRTTHIKIVLVTTARIFCTMIINQ